MPDADGLCEFADSHLMYEIGMFFTLAHYLERRILDIEFSEADDSGLPVRNASVEAFAIHMRALVDFFYGSPSDQYPKDALAVHYAPGWQAPPRTENLNRPGVKRVGTEIAHLSYGRMEVVAEARTWPFAAIRDDMHKVVLEFLRQLQPELVGEQFAERVREFLFPTPKGALEQRMDRAVDEMREMMGWEPTAAGTATQPLLPIPPPSGAGP